MSKQILLNALKKLKPSLHKFSYTCFNIRSIITFKDSIHARSNSNNMHYGHEYLSHSNLEYDLLIIQAR